MYPGQNATQDLGRYNRWWDDIWGKTGHIKDIRELYTHNSNYVYEIGTVVAFDPDSEYEIKPISSMPDRIIGVVAELPHIEAFEKCDSLGNCWDESYELSMDLAIYGKFHTVK